MALINREVERDALVALITADMVGAGQPVQVIYGYQTVLFAENKALTAMIVTSAASERDLRKTGNDGSTLFFDVHVFVLFEFADDSGNTWTEAQAEDRLDLIEHELALLLQANSTSTKKYAYAGRSQAGSLVLSGEEYRREIIPVSVWLANG